MFEEFADIFPTTNKDHYQKSMASGTLEENSNLEAIYT